jgi:hypothetical protein
MLFSLMLYTHAYYLNKRILKYFEMCMQSINNSAYNITWRYHKQMTKSIRLDDGTYDRLKAIQERYESLTFSQILDFLIESKVDMKKLEKVSK